MMAPQEVVQNHSAVEEVPPFADNSLHGTLALVDHPLYQALKEASALIETLDAHSVNELQTLLPLRVRDSIEVIADRVKSLGGGRLLFDSDGTGYFVLNSGDPERDAGYYAELAQSNRVLPGNAVAGEVSMEFIYSYQASPDMVEVWKRLSGLPTQVTVGILSGRKDSALIDMYQQPLHEVDGFMLLPSKGRATITQSGTELIGQLGMLLQDDPLRKVSEEMKENILSAIDPAQATLAKELSGGSQEFEKITGYRVSIQEIDGKVVLIRLHHRYRACQLAAAEKGEVENLENPKQVDGHALSSWLNSGNPSAEKVLAQLRREDEGIQQALSLIHI